MAAYPAIIIVEIHTGPKVIILERDYVFPFIPRRGMLLEDHPDADWLEVTTVLWCLHERLFRVFTEEQECAYNPDDWDGWRQHKWNH